MKGIILLYTSAQPSKLDKPQNGTGELGKSGLSTKIMTAYLPIVHIVYKTGDGLSMSYVHHVPTGNIPVLKPGCSKTYTAWMV